MGEYGDMFPLKPFGRMVAETRIGTTSRGASSQQTIPLMKMGNLRWGELDLTDVEMIDSDLVDRDAFLRTGDILFNTRNTPELVGKASLYRGEFPVATFDNNIMRIRLREGYDPAFVSAWLSSLGRTDLRQIATASTSVGAIYWRDLAELPVPEPGADGPRIATVLDAWDRAIAAAERAAGLARVRADGLRARLMQRPNAVEELTNLVDLVSNRFEASEGALSVELENIRSETGEVAEVARLESAGQRFQYRAGDTLFGRLRPYLNKFALADRDGLCSTEIWVLRPRKQRVLPEFLYLLTQHRAFKAAANRQSGSRMPRADWDLVSTAPVPAPSLDEQRRIVDVVMPALHHARHHTRQATLLRTQKRALMQRLLTGAQRLGPEFDAHLPPRAADAA